MAVLVIDVGTSSVRAAIVGPETTIEHGHRRALPTNVPMPGLVEFDPAEMARAALDVAAATLADVSSPVEAVGVTAQRASAVAWDGRSGESIGPGIGWQDLRTVGTCLELQGEGIRFSPSESATKFAWLMDQVDTSSENTSGWEPSTAGSPGISPEESFMSPIRATPALPVCSRLTAPAGTNTTSPG